MIVVTGGAGFLGSVLVWRLLEAGAGPLAVVEHNGVEDRAANLAGAPLSDWFEAGEFLRRLESGRGVPPIETVFHLGACSSTLETDLEYLRRNNFEYTQRLAQWCLWRGVRLIYASSAATYGDGAEGYAADIARLPRLRPLNPYARSKHDFDLWARERGAFRALAGLKYFNVFGPNEYHKGPMRSMVLKAHEQAAAGGPIRLFRSYRPEFPDGGQVRDFLYVEDAVAMTLWFFQHPEACGLFNLGAGVARSWNDLAAAVNAARGVASPIEYIEMPEALRGAYQYHTCADLGSLRAAGCTLTPRPLEAGVCEYVRKYLQAPEPHVRRKTVPA